MVKTLAVGLGPNARTKTKRCGCVLYRTALFKTFSRIAECPEFSGIGCTYPANLNP